MQYVVLVLLVVVVLFGSICYLFVSSYQLVLIIGSSVVSSCQQQLFVISQQPVLSSQQSVVSRQQLVDIRYQLLFVVSSSQCVVYPLLVIGQQVVLAYSMQYVLVIRYHLVLVSSQYIVFRCYVLVVSGVQLVLCSSSSNYQLLVSGYLLLYCIQQLSCGS